MSVVMTAIRSAEETRDLPVPPLAVGLIAFGLLTLLLFITLSFGKGRPHT